MLNRSRRRRWAGLRAISPTGAQIVHADRTAPEDHFTTSPDCRVRESGLRRVSRAGGSYLPGCPNRR